MRRVAIVLLALALPAAAQQSTRDWLKRILDPAPLGVVPFEGATVNRKITVDTIRYESNPAKQIVVYMVPMAQTDAAVQHFEKTLAVTPVEDTDPKGRPRYTYVVTGEGKQPAKAKGLTVMILRSPWVDDMAQIQMELVPSDAAH